MLTNDSTTSFINDMVFLWKACDKPTLLYASDFMGRSEIRSTCTCCWRGVWVESCGLGSETGIWNSLSIFSHSSDWLEELTGSCVAVFRGSFDDGTTRFYTLDVWWKLSLFYTAVESSTETWSLRTSYWTTGDMPSWYAKQCYFSFIYILFIILN